MWRGQFYWHLPDNAVMSVGATTSTPLPQKYQADTEKYSSQVTLVKNSDGGYGIQGYVAGVPFPKPSGPLAGVQILYNEYYAYVPYLITTYAHLGFSMDRYGSKYVTEVREVNFKLKHLSDPGKPADIPSTGDTFLTQNNVIWQPEQSKYVNSLQIFHDNPADLPDSYVFVPSLRRSIRLTTAARCSPLVGSDYTQDDERSMNLQPPIFDSKFLGYKKVLVGYPAPGYTDVNNYYKPLYFPGDKAVVWQCGRSRYWISGGCRPKRAVIATAAGWPSSTRKPGSRSGWTSSTPGCTFGRPVLRFTSRCRCREPRATLPPEWAVPETAITPFGTCKTTT